MSPPSQGWDIGQIGAVAGLAVLLVTAGWAGSSMFYTNQLKAQIEDELRPYAMELAETVTNIQTDLAPNMAAADELRIEINEARRDLIARDEEIEATIATAQSQLLGIRDSAIDDIERRLTDQTDDLTSMLDEARKRAVELDRGLNEVGQALAAFEHQLPVLTDKFGKITATLVENQSKVKKVDQETKTLNGVAPLLLETIAEHQSGVEAGTKTLAILQTQLEALKTQTARSSRQPWSRSWPRDAIRSPAGRIWIVRSTFERKRSCAILTSTPNSLNSPHARVPRRPCRRDGVHRRLSRKDSCSERKPLISRAEMIRPWALRKALR